MNDGEHNPGEPTFGEHGEGQHNPGEPEFGPGHEESLGADWVDPENAAEEMEDETEGRS